MKLREVEVPEGFGRELHHPSACFKKITLSTVEERAGGGRPVIKEASGGGPLGEHSGSICWGRVKIQFELVTDWLCSGPEDC